VVNDRNVGTVLVTGGSSGLGAAVAAAVREAGGTALVLDRQPPEAADGHHIVDLADTRSAEEAVRTIVDAHGGRLDGVVAAAGIDRCGKLTDVDGKEWEQVIAVNLLGTAAVSRAALPYLERSGGRLVTVASTLGLRALSDATAYCASKFGVVGFTRALAAEMAGRVGVTLLIPGGMSTHFFDDRPQQYRPGADAKLNSPENVAQAVLFALQQPVGCELRELVIASSEEPSWP
jgi:NAD(P)-dependent dehydrogenase (short-subunit alcohol dehydrogenase family)